MSARHKRRISPGDTSATREFAELAGQGRSSITAHARLRRLIEVGYGLGMTSGDTVRLAVETLRALDQHGQFRPAVEDTLGAFDAGRLVTEVREPMNLYVDRSAVSALAVAVCETCRPNINPRDSNAEPTSIEIEPVPLHSDDGGGHVEREWPHSDTDLTSIHLEHASHWPERTLDGFPQITLKVRVWWPGLSEWEEATLTASVSQSLSFTGENFTLLIEQEGDSRPARTNAVWLLRRDDLGEELPVYELRASTWEVGDDEALQYRFFVATSSPWWEELHDYLAARWISQGKSPTGPEDFDSVTLGGDQPPVRPSMHIVGS